MTGDDIRMNKKFMKKVVLSLGIGVMGASSVGVTSTFADEKTHLKDKQQELAKEIQYLITLIANEKKKAKGLEMEFNDLKKKWMDFEAKKRKAKRELRRLKVDDPRRKEYENTINEMTKKQADLKEQNVSLNKEIDKVESSIKQNEQKLIDLERQIKK